MDQLSLQVLLNELPIGICVFNKEHKILLWNHFLANRTGISEKNIIGMSLLEVFPRQARFLEKKIQSVFVLHNSSFSYWEHNPHVFELNSSRPITGEETMMFQNIEFTPLLNKLQQTDLVCMILQDVTELASYMQQEQQLKAELEKEHMHLIELNIKLETAHNQLLQSEKMAAIGQLAAGVAHEINNPLGFINSNLHTMKDYCFKMLRVIDFYEKIITKANNAGLNFAQAEIYNQTRLKFIKDDVESLLAESIDGAERVSSIVNNLKSFSQVDNSQWRYSSVVECLESTINISLSQSHQFIEVFKDYQPDLPDIYCQPLQLNQVFLNIIVNACHAINDNGKLHFKIKKDDVNLYISIQDTGSGIAPEHISRLFEPFFTTKPVGQGTGLGLSLSWSIIQQHSGRIDVVSQQGIGSTFTVVLPLKHE